MERIWLALDEFSIDKRYRFEVRISE